MTTTIPAWFTARQEAAKARYESIPTPKRNDILWRFSNIKQLDFTNLSGEAVHADHAEIISRSTGLAKPAAKFVFLNDEIIHSESSLPENVICLPLAYALVSHPDLV